MSDCSWIGAVADFINRVGFPVALVFYFVFRFEGVIKANTEVTAGLARGLLEYGIGTRGNGPGRPPGERPQG